jgi:hypothetical protein
MKEEPEAGAPDHDRDERTHKVGERHFERSLLTLPIDTAVPFGGTDAVGRRDRHAATFGRGERFVRLRAAATHARTTEEAANANESTTPITTTSPRRLFSQTL